MVSNREWRRSNDDIDARLISGPESAATLMANASRSSVATVPPACQREVQHPTLCACIQGKLKYGVPRQIPQNRVTSCQAFSLLYQLRPYSHCRAAKPSAL